MEKLAGRAYARVYRAQGRADLHQFLLDAVASSEARVLFASEPTRTPVFLGVQTQKDERLGLLVYPFRCNPPPIKGRAPDEHRVQIRYSAERTWGEDHTLGQDVAGVDLTLVLAVHLQAGLFIGLDPLLYDPLPMGISVEFKDEQVNAAGAAGWHVWERENRPGRRRAQARALEGLETLVAFEPSRLLDYARFEREASGLGLDPPLRLRAAEAALEQPAAEVPSRLEAEFELSSQEILEIIGTRMRLRVAVRGGVAEHHLERVLRSHPGVTAVQPMDADGEPDFDVELAGGRRVRVECKNCSPTPYADGAYKVEVQKTRHSRDDPSSRYYPADHFDVLAACLYPVTGRWEFRFAATRDLARHGDWPERLQPMQRVDERWSEQLPQAL